MIDSKKDDADDLFNETKSQLISLQFSDMEL